MTTRDSEENLLSFFARKCRSAGDLLGEAA